MKSKERRIPKGTNRQHKAIRGKADQRESQREPIETQLGMTIRMDK